MHVASRMDLNRIGSHKKRRKRGHTNTKGSHPLPRLHTRTDSAMRSENRASEHAAILFFRWFMYVCMAHLMATNPNASHKLMCSNMAHGIRRGSRSGCYRVRSSSELSELQLQIENGSLVCENGWRVRRLNENEDEIRKAAHVQAQAFHVPVALFNQLFFQFFQAEVFSGLLYKLKNSPPNRYACLVAEPAENDPDPTKQLVGVIDVTVLTDQSVLQHLHAEAKEYIYISGIAVSKTFRRRKVATALLKACDMLAVLWGFEFLALRAYEEDLGARKLYTNAGYQVVSRDPPWTSNWIGRKCRVLMIKRTRSPISLI